MAFCSKCGHEVMDEAEICVNCGCRIKGASRQKKGQQEATTIFCSKCGHEVRSDAEICMNCGCRIKGSSSSEGKQGNLGRFLLTFFFGWIGSFIINHSSLKPDGWKSRTCAYFFLSLITFGIYGLVATICNITFNPNASSNIGYFKD